ncbi:ATP-binding region ATPase domain protein [Isosphaera pallida ATCC 43644]|jgi:anti-sigma regulatory factor (Ser/Thr protein kinase)|uniref:ATP-binding region ATPase domain protein n=1 Tax=Isosphaera pallida (strain ATCC 43644 / DSM 9630 / IS1B) TaxID=575540 RepID=E8R176_ISOPI|nr:ATP-binding protein [Isosphaera pallida]ADV61282.1 ATP-binding region ATPase domain protein [Isosphaera pallida ATCC 43644]
MSVVDSALVLRNELAEIPRLARWIAEFLETQGLGDDPSIVHDVQLCLEEIVTNIIKYAYAQEGPREIWVRLEYRPDALVAQVEDDGEPFNPLEHPRPDLSLGLAEVEPGGLGIELVREYMDDLSYHWNASEGRNCLRMVRRLAVSAA